MNNIVNEARATATLALMTIGEVHHIDVFNLPEKWENFADTKNRWIKINLPDDQEASACLFEGKKGHIFPPHLHNKYIEHSIIINRTGKIKVVTKKYIKTLEFPNSILFEKNEEHAIVFEEDTKLLVVWHPKIGRNLEAEFLDKNDFQEQ